MQRKAGFSQRPAVKKVEHSGKDAFPFLPNEQKIASPPLRKFQNLVSTVTMTQALRKRAQFSMQRHNENSGEFLISHTTSPDDDDRRLDTTLTDPSTIRGDVLSRLNMSDRFRFTTSPNRKFQVRFCHLLL